MRMLKFIPVLVGLAAWGVSASAGPAPGARLNVDCQVSGQQITITLSAKSKGGGKPQDITQAGPVFLLVDQKVNNNWTGVGGGVAMTMQTTPLPVSGTLQLCPGVSPNADQIRGRGVVFITGVGMVASECSPKSPPTC